VTKFIHPANIAFYTHDEKFVSINDALANPTKVVSIGWKAIGRGIWQLARKDGLVVDFSTRTTSFIPIREGKILSESQSDLDRIKNDELLFLGFLETNVAFIQPKFTFNGEDYNLPFETHAITADLFLITGDLQPNDYVTETPDKKAKFREDALERFKSMLCIIDDSFSENDLVKIAHLLKTRMLERINSVIKKKLQEYNLTRVIVTGIGNDLLYKFLYDKNEYAEIIQTSDILKTTEVNPSYSLAYIYATKKDDE
jgi:probable H4MPT-linked C1 transfer pathway protein